MTAISIAGRARVLLLKMFLISRLKSCQRGSSVVLMQKDACHA